VVRRDVRRFLPRVPVAGAGAAGVVAIAAITRKLILLANALLKANRSWQLTAA
jgi:hypothetical protein